MKLSVALCTYNGERFLREQLDSIARQTLLPDELVVCDDRSGDGTLVILRSFKRQAPFPVHIHQNEQNLGSTKNFEKAIALCSGDIISLCDQDDIWMPHKLQRLTEVLEAHPEAGYVFSDAELVDENLRLLGYSLWDSVGFQEKARGKFLQGAQFHCLAQKNIVTGATMAFRSPIGRMAMPFPEKGYWIHDAWIVLISSAVGIQGVPVDEVLISYRQHPKQQIGVPGQPQKKQTLLGMYIEMKMDHQRLFALWEKFCLRTLSLEATLRQLQAKHNSPALEQNLSFLQDYEIHFRNRRKIMTSRDLGRYLLILREALSGRYATFSNSWRTMIRDLLL